MTFHAPGERAAEDRVWEVVRAAYEQREPVSWPRRHWQPLVAVAVVAAVVAAAFSPQGRSVVHSLREAVGVKQAEQVDAPAPERAERDEELLAELGRLSPEHRAVIVLRYLLEYTPGEIAELLELPRGTVNSRLRRGLDALEERLQ